MHEHASVHTWHNEDSIHLLSHMTKTLALCRLQSLEILPSAIFSPIQTSFHVNCAFCSEQILHFHLNEENGNVALSVWLTETTVRSTVAMPAVTHFLSGGYDQSTRSVVLTWVCTAHWTHQDTHCHILMPFSLKCLFFSKTLLTFSLFNGPIMIVAMHSLKVLYSGYISIK